MVKPFLNTCKTSSINLKSVYIGLIASLFVASSQAAKEEIIENPLNNGYLSDTWVVKYQENDFSEKITDATLLYVPKNFAEEAAFLVRCNPFFTNFSMQYVESQKNLMQNGELNNDSDKFAKHGYIYDEKQRLSVEIGGDSQSYTLSVGGQKNHLTQLFKTQQSIQPGQLGMSWFYSFTFKEMPSFRPGTTPDDAKDFFKQINYAINRKIPIDFTLKTNQGHQRLFSLDTQRMAEFVPPEVMDFCLTNRQLK